MNWQDLIAWHQVQETLAIASTPGLVQLCDQDPARIYLSISQGTVTSAGQLCWLSIVPPSAYTAQGLPLGANVPGSIGNGIILGASAYTLGLSGGPNLPFLFDVGAGTGTFWISDIELALDPSGDPPTGIYNTPNLQPYYAPQRYEFWLDRHGALAQLAWYTWDSVGGCPFTVHTVRQERNPCDFTATGQMMPVRPKQWSIPRGRSLFSRVPRRRHSASAVSGGQHELGAT